MNHEPCGCCEGVDKLTPLPRANRPGLTALTYRVGTHATFFETMKACLSTLCLDDEDDCRDGGGLRPLQGLTTRETDDPAIALLDGWATVADVLSFYQERIANEGYLLTATERRSILELARLVGYTLRPGVASTVYLAFTLEQEYKIEIPQGTRAQSIPNPGELPQAFETAEAIPARTEWNAIKPRKSHPQALCLNTAFNDARTMHLDGVATNLKVNDAILIGEEQQGDSVSISPPVYQVQSVETKENEEENYTVVTYRPLRAETADPSGGTFIGPTSILVDQSSEITVVGANAGSRQSGLGSLVQALRRQPSLPPANRFHLARPLEQTFNAASDLGPQLLVNFSPILRNTLYSAYAEAPLTPTDRCPVEAFRVKASLFGHNAPVQFIFDDNNKLTDRQEWSLAEGSSDTLHLDTTYEGITPGSWVVVDRADRTDSPSWPLVTRVLEVRTISRAAYGLTGKVTQLVLKDPWLDNDDTSLSVIRGTTVYGQSELLDQAGIPLSDPVGGNSIELDGLYDGLVAGRWLVVSGQRADLTFSADQGEANKEVAEGKPVEGVRASELVMLAGVSHGVQQVTDKERKTFDLPGDTLHTTLTLSTDLAYTYKRDTVTLNANVAKATHGETREEVLGSGDGSKALQRFTLKQVPLTHLAAPTPAGAESTLEVRVNDVQWHEESSLVWLDGASRGFSTQTDDDAETTVIFGDGKHGVRLPTGVENVKAVYRSGIGKIGNVGAERISQLATKPLGVKEVLNPIAALGGADAESRDQARRNVPLAVMALDRLVSVQDYADFTRTFAGIAKASATRLSDGRRTLVYLTIAGLDDILIEEHSDLYRNLRLAVHRFGDPHQPVEVAMREVMFLFLSAQVSVLPDYEWESVEPKVRASLLDALSFDRRALGQDVLLSEVISAIQAVEGVAYVDVDLLESISESEAEDPEKLANKLEEIAAAITSAPADEDGKPIQPKQRIVAEMARINPNATDPAERIRPAQLAYLTPNVADTLILTEVTL